MSAERASLIDRLRVRPLLDGVRGAPAADVDALAHAVVASRRSSPPTSATSSRRST